MNTRSVIAGLSCVVTAFALCAVAPACGGGNPTSGFGASSGSGSSGGSGGSSGGSSGSSSGSTSRSSAGSSGAAAETAAAAAPQAVVASCVPDGMGVQRLVPQQRHDVDHRPRHGSGRRRSALQHRRVRPDHRARHAPFGGAHRRRQMLVQRALPGRPARLRDDRRRREVHHTERAHRQGHDGLVIQVGKWRTTVDGHDDRVRHGRTPARSSSRRTPPRSSTASPTSPSRRAVRTRSSACSRASASTRVSTCPGWTKPGSRPHLQRRRRRRRAASAAVVTVAAPARWRRIRWPVRSTGAGGLWDSTADLMKNDIVLLSCEGGETSGAVPQNLEDYLNAGGRAFASHFHYAWFNGLLLGRPRYSAPSDWGSNLAGLERRRHRRRRRKQQRDRRRQRRQRR